MALGDCAPEERRELHQIPTQRFPNFAVWKALQQLKRKGLITDSALDPIMNTTFRKFLRIQPEPDQPQLAGKEGQDSAFAESAMESCLRSRCRSWWLSQCRTGLQLQGLIVAATTALGAIGSTAKLFAAPRGRRFRRDCPLGLVSGGDAPGRLPARDPEGRHHCYFLAGTADCFRTCSKYCCT